jgi:hypothetical protein
MLYIGSVFSAIRDMHEIQLISRNSSLFYGESIPRFFVALP